MLSPRWRKVLRDVWLHKSRTSLVVAAIVVGIVGAGSILNAWALVEVATRDGYRASNPPSATIRTDSVDDALLARVLAIPSVRDAQARRTVTASIQSGGTWLPALLFVTDDFTAIRIGALHPEVGAWPPLDGAIVIERSSLDFSAASVGESLKVAIGDRSPFALQVTGVARDVGLAPGWMEHVVYAFVTRGTLERLGVPTAPNELRIVVREPGLDQPAVRRIAFDVKRVVEATGRKVTDVDVPVPGEHIHAAQMDSLLLTQGAFGVLALLLSAFLVVNLIAAMLAGQVREIGVMKAMGARHGQLAAMYLAIAALLGLVASAIALPIASVIGARYAELKGELLNFPLEGFSVPLWVTALQFIVGAVLPVLAASIPVRRGCGISVGEALRDVGIDGDDPGRGGALLQRVGGVSRPTLLSIRNAFRKRQRMVLTMLALSMGGAVFLGARNLRVSIEGAVGLLFSAQRFDFALRLTEAHQADSVERLVRGLSGVKAVEAWTGTRGTLQHGDGTLGNRFSITAPPAATTLLVPRLIRGRWLVAGDRTALVVSDVLLKQEPTIRVGSAVDVVIDTTASRWTVVGVVSSGPAPIAYVALEALAPMVAGGGATAVAVKSSYDGAASQVELIQRARAALEGGGIAVVSSQLLAESRRIMEDHLLMVSDFLAVMGWLMIVVGGLGLASTMSLAVLERTREIGVMRAIGARHRAIFAMTQVEGLVVALLSWAIALPLSVPMSVILAGAFGRVMIPVPVTYLPEASGAILWLALVIVVSVLACAWPAMRAMRVTTAAALSYE